MRRGKAYDLKAATKAAITPVEYSGLQTAIDHFNAELFDGSLGEVFVTYQRRAHTYGYFSPDRFSSRVGGVARHELALNPDGFIGRSDEDILSTIVHEMVHCWQRDHGKRSKEKRPGYHDKEWAAKMKAIGLQPSSTSMVGGKETGQHMSHYIIPGGPFSRSYERLAATAGWKLNLQSAPRPGQPGGTNSKTKFTCPECAQNAWGKPDLAIVCEVCNVKMLAPGAAAAIDGESVMLEHAA